MAGTQLVEQFIAASEGAGSRVLHFAEPEPAIAYIVANAGGSIAVPAFPSGERIKLAERLNAGGLEISGWEPRSAPADAAASVTGANFALAATGTVVLESTSEQVRLATTLPERHFVLLDPSTIIPDDLAAAPLLRQFHLRDPRNYLAYITGPSRTADIERVLTIGVHGPKELHILLIEGLSQDPLEM